MEKIYSHLSALEGEYSFSRFCGQESQTIKNEQLTAKRIDRFKRVSKHQEDLDLL